MRAPAASSELERIIRELRELEELPWAAVAARLNAEGIAPLQGAAVWSAETCRRIYNRSR